MTSGDIVHISGPAASSSSIDNCSIACGDAVQRDALAIEMNTARTVPIPDDVAMLPETLALRSELNELRICATMMQQANLAEHENYTHRFEVAAQTYKIEAREVTRVEIAQSQAQMNAHFSSAMLQITARDSTNARFSRSTRATCENSSASRVRRGAAINSSASRTPRENSKRCTRFRTKEALIATDMEIQQQQQSLTEDARVFAAQE